MLRPRIDKFNANNEAYVAGILGITDEEVFEGADAKDRILGTDRRNIKDAVVDETDKIYIGYRG